MSETVAMMEALAEKTRAAHGKDFKESDHVWIVDPFTNAELLREVEKMHTIPVAGGGEIKTHMGTRHQFNGIDVVVWPYARRGTVYLLCPETMS